VNAAFFWTGATILLTPLLSPEKLAEVEAYVYGPWMSEHLAVIAKGDLRPRLYDYIRRWATVQQQMADGTTIPAIAADGARLIELDGRTCLWFVFDDMRLRLEGLSRDPAIITFSKHDVSQLLGCCCLIMGSSA
jgi:hypothetical protein